MREGKLYIDNKDAFIHYGVFIQETGYNGVLSYPPLKAPEVSNDWAEYDGIEVDLSDPKLDLKEFEISLPLLGIIVLGIYSFFSLMVLIIHLSLGRFNLPVD